MLVILNHIYIQRGQVCSCSCGQLLLSLSVLSVLGYWGYQVRSCSFDWLLLDTVASAS
jgi:hypothetical protein